jgi:arsenate reductase
VDGQEVPKRVLILCTGNSCRSQIAEGLWRALAGDRWEVASAGARPAGTVHPLAVEAMQEIGIDISSHRSKHVDEFAGQNFDLLVTVCDSARESCPTLPRVKRAVHWSFHDPAAVEGSEQQKRAAFREVRDQIRERIGTFLRAER